MQNRKFSSCHAQCVHPVISGPRLWYSQTMHLWLRLHVIPCSGYANELICIISIMHAM